MFSEDIDDTYYFSGKYKRLFKSIFEQYWGMPIL
jgi:hypothetical protein